MAVRNGICGVILSIESIKVISENSDDKDHQADGFLEPSTTGKATALISPIGNYADNVATLGLG